ncbi:hypothetical protein BDQ12DRAFT_728873 [Crucibulum laeve]|uniref:(4-O-methyl)-D-glucuronate--lignin esterase n=1 Tax=Crucibulum laeve TaxID=68775 RepID=A0A5C3LHD3_9AGAR|nr:hypothetical protein BDQ12DRAFT_728873 [Crucibulum laeve]
MAFKHSLVAVCLVLPAFTQQLLCAQCGGNGWSGGTNCVAGATCTCLNDCLSTSSSTTTSTTPQPTSQPGNCPALSTNSILKANSKHPDTFAFFSYGSRVTTKAQWECRHEESVTGSYSGGRLTINVSETGKSISFTATVTTPSGPGLFPTIIAYGDMSIPTPASISVITFNNDDIAAQANTGSRGQGKFYWLLS